MPTNKNRSANSVSGKDPETLAGLFFSLQKSVKTSSTAGFSEESYPRN